MLTSEDSASSETEESAMEMSETQEDRDFIASDSSE